MRNKESPSPRELARDTRHAAVASVLLNTKVPHWASSTPFRWLEPTNCMIPVRGVPRPAPAAGFARGGRAGWVPPNPRRCWQVRILASGSSSY